MKIRYTFKDGSSEVLDAREVASIVARQKRELKEALEMERAILDAARYAQMKGKSEAAKKGREIQRETNNLNARDKEIRAAAAKEKKKKAYGYIKRTAQQFPKLRYDAVKAIIQKK